MVGHLIGWAASNSIQAQSREPWAIGSGAGLPFAGCAIHARNDLLSDA